MQISEKKNNADGTDIGLIKKDKAMKNPKRIFLIVFIFWILFFNLFVNVFIDNYVSIFQFYLEKLSGVEIKEGVFLFLLQKRAAQLIILFLLLEIGRRDSMKILLLAAASICCAYLAVLTSLAYGIYTIVLYPLFFLPHGVAYLAAFAVFDDGIKKKSPEHIFESILLFLVGILLEAYVNYPILAAFLKKI